MAFVGMKRLCLRSVGAHPHGERCRIARLHEHGARARKFANQALSRAYAGDNTSTGHSFHDIFAVPCYQVAVVDDVLLLGL